MKGVCKCGSELIIKSHLVECVNAINARDYSGFYVFLCTSRAFANRDPYYLGTRLCTLCMTKAELITVTELPYIFRDANLLATVFAWQDEWYTETTFLEHIQHAIYYNWGDGFKLCRNNYKTLSNDDISDALNCPKLSYQQVYFMIDLWSQSFMHFNPCDSFCWSSKHKDRREYTTRLIANRKRCHKSIMALMQCFKKRHIQGCRRFIVKLLWSTRYNLKWSVSFVNGGK